MIFKVTVYRGKDRRKKGDPELESEIDLIIEDGNTLYPVKA